MIGIYLLSMIFGMILLMVRITEIIMWPWWLVTLPLWGPYVAFAVWLALAIRGFDKPLEKRRFRR